ncbi:hypothetical protein ARSEF4850_003597 [Beauveria asiatica]
MVAQTRSQTAGNQQAAGNQQTRIKEPKTNQREKNGIPKRGDPGKASKALAKTLDAAVDAYEKADDGKKAEMQNQLNVRQPLDNPDAMDRDDNPAGGLDVKKEIEEGSMFVSPISRDPERSPEKSEGSPSDPTPSSDKGQDPKPLSGKEQDSTPPSGKEQDTKPPGDNSHEKLRPPNVEFENGLATPPTEDDDKLVLVRANPVRERFHGSSENVGWCRLAFGRAFDIEKQGPRNAPRFRFRRHTGELKAKSLDDLAYGIITQINGEKLYQCGDIAGIYGVVWQPLKGIDHYSSLAPRNWKRGNRTVRPPMRIMVKWMVDHEAGDEERKVLSWEKRDAVLRCFEDDRGNGGATVLCEEELRLGETVIVEKGESILLCDWAIVTAAHRGEKRFQEWESGQRPDRDRSPTPGLPLLGKAPMGIQTNQRLRVGQALPTS